MARGLEAVACGTKAGGGVKTDKEIREAFDLLCAHAWGKKPGLRPFASIPARPDHDADLIVSSALDELEQRRAGDGAKVSIELARRIAALRVFWAEIEERSADAHAVYQREAHRRGDVRHADAYADLAEPTKEWDRVLVRWVLEATEAILDGKEPPRIEVKP